MSDLEERRCPNCRALVSADAEWCGQCFTSLRTTPAPPATPDPDAAPDPEPAAGRVVVAADPTTKDEAAARWTCPACDHENGLDLDVCEVCGTPFAALFRQGEQRPQVDPGVALRRSLIFPGLGHRAVGRGADGLARAVLFSYTFGMTVLILLSGPSSGPAVALLAVYGSLSVALYAFTAVEAQRLARGGDPIVSSRVLLWGVVALILLSVLMAVATIFAAAKS